MDIISHTLTGVAVGTVLATFSNGSMKEKGSILLAGASGGALPDFDAISLWSNFDSTIGTLFDLEHSGKQIYFGKFWYSHHAALHSILAPIVLIFLSIVAGAVFRRNFKLSKVKANVFKRKYSLFAFFLGYVFHLLEDMPTPSSVWGGVNLFFPDSTYVGGFGKIWWWNNYDLVLIILSVIILNLLINLIPKISHKLRTIGSIGVFTLGLIFFLFQVNTRPTDFNYSGHTANYSQLEAESKLIQKEILGERLFKIMTEIDNRIPLNF
ncbi:metal-dependent hydrolase [Halocola ammonii]